MRALASAFALPLLITLFLSACDRRSDPDSYVAEARELQHKGERAAAIIQVKNALQLKPDHAEARYLLGTLFLESGEARAAEQELRQAVELHFDPKLALPALAKSLLLQSEYQQVLDETTPERLAAVGNSAAVASMRGHAQIALNREAQARASLEQALALEPEFPDALLGQAKLAVVKQDAVGALALIERALARSPGHVDGLLMKGDLQRLLGNDEGAAAAYRRVIELQPDETRGRLSLASIDISRKQYDEAIRNIAEVLKKAPANPTANYLRGLIEFRRGNYVGAQQFAAAVLTVQPTHIATVILAGASEYGSKEYRRAQIHLKWVLDRAPGNLYVRKLLVATLVKSNQPKLAIEVLQPALAQAPDDPNLLALAGDVYMQANDFAKATQWFEKAAQLEPRNPGKLIGLGVSRLAAGEVDQAVADLQEAAALAPDKAQTAILLAMAHLQRREPDQALGVLNALDGAGKPNPLVLNLKGSAYVGKKNLREARRAFEQALAIEPTYFPAAMNLAQIDLREKQPEAARRRLEAALAKDRGNATVMLAIADILSAVPSQAQEVLRWIERAREAQPNDARPAIHLAAHYLRAGEPRQAVEAAQRAVKHNAENPELLDILAQAQVAAGNVGDALGVYEKIVALQPQSATVYYRLAWLQNESGGMPATVRGTLRKALELDAGHPDAIALLAAVEARSGNRGEGLRLAGQLRKKYPKSHIGDVLEGDIHMVERRFAEAIRAYERADTVAKTPVILKRLFDAYTRAGKSGEGEARMLAWLAHNPSDAATRQYFADASLKSGRLATAIAQYEQLAKNQPRNQQVLNNLAWAYSRVEDARALRTAEQAYEIDRINPAAADTLGWILLQRGNVERSVELLRNASAAAPQSPDIRYHYAVALAKSGDRKAARRELERVLASTRFFDQLAEARKLLAELQD